MTFEDYVRVVIRQLEVLPPETVIERLTGDGDKTKLLAPLWSRDKIRVLGTIDHEMAQEILGKADFIRRMACKKDRKCV